MILMAPESDILTAERIVRLETKLDLLLQQVDRLPPSPVCMAEHIALRARISSLETWRNRAAGALLIVNLVFVIAIDKIRAWWFGP
jgi:hypothetical protein